MDEKKTHEARWALYTGPETLSHMVGSLFQVAETEKEELASLTENWHKITRRWYPKMHETVYSVPPAHCNALAFKHKAKKEDAHEMKNVERSLTLYGLHVNNVVPYSTVKSDETQQRVLSLVSSYIQRNKGIAFILSSMDYHAYLSKNYVWRDPTLPQMPAPDKARPEEEGDFDILVIHKQHGVFVLEIKAVGDTEEIWDTYAPDKGKKLQEVKKVLGGATYQCQKAKDILKKLLKDIDPDKGIKIRRGWCISTFESHSSYTTSVWSVSGGEFPMDASRPTCNPYASAWSQRIVLPYVKRKMLRELTEHFDSIEALRKVPAMSTDGLNKKLDVIITTETILRDLELKKLNDIHDLVMCCEDLPGRGVFNMTDESYRKMDRFWKAFQAFDGDSKPMSDDQYEKIIARFCGPLTTVKIYTEKTYPRVKLAVAPKGKPVKKKGKNGQHAKVKLVPDEGRDPASIARIMARRFSELVLLQDQIDILQRNEDFVHLEGPPGTGKTLMLLLRILTWLDDGHMVWILSLAPPSRSVSHVLMEQVKNMISQSRSRMETYDILARLRLFMVLKPDYALDKDYYKRLLEKFRCRAQHKYKDNLSFNYNISCTDMVSDRKVCLVVDESGMAGKGVEAFFNQITVKHKEKYFTEGEFDKGLSVWSASIEKKGRPHYVTAPGQATEDQFGVLWDLTLPLRCPPTVQRALMLVQPSMDKENVWFFTEEAMLSHPAKQTGTDDREVYAAQGLPVYLIGHGSHKDPEIEIWYCYECGADLAKYLTEVLRIGEEECTCPEKPIIYDEIPEGKKKCPDCGKWTKGYLPAGSLPLKYNDVLIVATQQAFLMSVPLGKFFLALYDYGLKLAVNTTREEGAAPLPPDDVILVVDMTSVHGLERAVIVVVPEVKPPKPLLPRYEYLFYPSGLPQEIEKQMEKAWRKGKDGVTVKADGTVEEDMSVDEHDSDATPGQQNVASDEGPEAQDTCEEKPHPYNFSDPYSEDEITMAIESLSAQSRHDLYYIGSRAVCQLILVHLGKDREKDDLLQQTEEPMETD